MILHKLVARHLKHRDDPCFYSMQAEDAIRWIQEQGVVLTEKTRILDLGCGHGVFGGELLKRGYQVAFADEDHCLLPELSDLPFHKFNIDRDDIKTLGQFDLVICSNVLEHLAKPKAFLHTAQELLTPQGKLYLSWTNWLSPWGGHEFSPFHYLGPRHGHLLYDRVAGRKRIHTPFVNLFPTHIGPTLKQIAENRSLHVIAVAPRYYTEFSVLMRIPVLREFLAWNCAMLIGRRAGSSKSGPQSASSVT
jgi:SAM-dependent methyltransferase